MATSANLSLCFRFAEAKALRDRFSLVESCGIVLSLGLVQGTRGPGGRRGLRLGRRTRCIVERCLECRPCQSFFFLVLNRGKQAGPNSKWSFEEGVQSGIRI